MNKNETKKQNKQEISSKRGKSTHAVVATKKNSAKVKTKIPSKKLVKPVKLAKDETVHNMSKTEFENFIAGILMANGFLPIGKIEVREQYVGHCDSTVYYSVQQFMTYNLDPETVPTTYV
jgi:hypothetical protein